MKNIKFVTLNGELNPADHKIMVDGMLSYHASKGHPRKSETFSILMKDNNDKLFGCVVVSFLWNGMEIQSLWVDESIRKKGWGRKLMEAAEAEAMKRGCTLAYTNTFTWQAPKFYTKLGYTLYGKLDDFPPGNTLYYFRKDLVPKATRLISREK